MLNPFQTASRFAKRSSDVTDALGRTALLSGAAGLGVGATAAGAAHLISALRRAISPTRPVYPAAVLASLPAKPMDDEDDEVKLAQAQPTMDIPLAEATPFATMARVVPFMGGAGVGWMGMRKLFEMRRKSELDDELDEAKDQFRRSVLDGYKTKTASERDDADLLSEKLDQLYDQRTKQADEPPPESTGLGRFLNRWGGHYLGGVAAPLALLGGYLGYSSGAKNTDRAALQKAMQMRSQAAYNARPSEILVSPETRRRKMLDETEMSPVEAA